MKGPLRTKVVDGQNYVDDPVFVKPKPIPAIDRILADVFGRSLPEPFVARHERVRLRWMKPDRDGKLVPR